MELWTVSVRLILSMFLGGVVGLERQSKHRPAGFRTHILVCTGSSLIMCLTEYVIVDYSLRFGIMADPLRLGAQVISGIGFLGVGTIIISGSNVKGLTTAAGLWTVACIGLAAGAGFYEGALLTTVLIMITLFVFSKLSRNIDEQFNVIELRIETEKDARAIGAVTVHLSGAGVKITDMECIPMASGETRSFKMTLQLPKKESMENIMGALCGIDRKSTRLNSSH